MRILIVSDTHRMNRNYLELVERMQSLDLIIHCGDVEGSEYTLKEAAPCPVMMIAGNNDFFCQLPRELDFNIGKYKVWVTHGHNYFVYSGTKDIKEAARSRGADIVCFGHTHQPVVEREDDLVLINPGSISYPRQSNCRPSYVIMDVDREGEAHFTVAYL